MVGEDADLEDATQFGYAAAMRTISDTYRLLAGTMVDLDFKSSVGDQAVRLQMKAVEMFADAFGETRRR